MNPELMTEKLQMILMNALSLCKEHNHSELSSEHLLSAFFNEEDIVELLGSMHTDVNKLIMVNDTHLNRLPSTDYVAEPMVNRHVAEAYNEAYQRSRQRQDKYISMFDMFISILFNKSSVSEELRKYCGFSKDDIEA
ncbi:MAG: hypothetical protein IKX97_07055, partial [Erysipelotrichaceae bacterium]|nr:hypothetical protein [Erysipelotrichaceae bacterium]